MVPKRKKACPACGQFIYVRRTPESTEKTLMTRAQADEVERRWSIYVSRSRCVSILSAFGLGENELAMERLHGAHSDDVAATVVLLRRITIGSDDLHQRMMAFHDLACIADKENKPFRGYLTQSVRYALLHHRSGRFASDRVEVRAGSSCPQCQAHDREVYSVDEALRLMPIPRADCTHTLLGSQPGFCRCMWLPVLKHS